MSAKNWGQKGWSKATKARRLETARAAMQAIDDKFAAKEAESYLDPDKGWATFKEGGNSGTSGEGRVDADAIASLEGDFEFLAPDYAAPVGSCGGVAQVDADAATIAALAPYKSLEHAFQAAKCGAGGGGAIRDCRNAREAKKVGAKALASRPKAEADAFRAGAVPLMERLLVDKFARSPDLLEKLLKTDGRRIVHANDFNDGFWGVKGDRTGRNELGLALGRVRATLSEAADGPWRAWCGDRSGVEGLDARDAGFDLAWRRSGETGLSRLDAVEGATFFVAGHAESCELRVEHASCSRIHAALLNAGGDDDGAACVADLGSRHGTFAHRRGAEPVELAPFVVYKLRKTDEVRFGASTKRFRFVVDRDLRKRKADRLLRKMAEDPEDDDEDDRTARLTSLSYDADESDVRALFSDFEIRVDMCYESASSRRHRGEVYALFRTRGDLARALALDGDEVKGRRVRVQRASAPPPEKRIRRD